MENDVRGGLPPRPMIPQVLIEATIKAIKAGMRPDDASKLAAARGAIGVGDAQQTLKGGVGGDLQSQTIRGGNPQTVFADNTCCLRKVSRFAREQEENENLPQQGQGLTQVKKKGAGKSDRKLKGSAFRKGGEDETTDPERTYRNFDERQMGLLVVGDQHRFAGAYGADKLIFPAEPPLDFSFCMINRIEEIVINEEHPQTSRLFRIPDKTLDDRYETSSLWLSYNVINELDGLINVLYKILDGGPHGLCWLDVSFNAISKLDEDTLSQLPNLKILYLHGNALIDMTEVRKLKVLSRSLTTLTLHGNPLDEEEGYRIAVIYYLPDLLHFDFSGVTKSDRANSQGFGRKYEPYWEQRHEVMEAHYKALKKAAEITYTEKVMESEKDDYDEVDFANFK